MIEEIEFDNVGNLIRGIDLQDDADDDEWVASQQYKPILRPLSDLYKTITHNGKEIVPIVECAKIALPDFEFLIGNKLCYCEDNHRGLIQFYMEEGAFKTNFVDTGYMIVNQIPLFDYLNSLKIDYRGLIDAEKAVSVYDLDINPFLYRNHSRKMRKGAEHQRRRLL
jgi:hypothetical protein